MKITVEQHNEEAKDIFTPGNIVAHKSKTHFVVVLVSDYVAVYDGHFSGYCVQHVNSQWVNTHGTDWEKDQFVQFHGTITLEV